VAGVMQRMTHAYGCGAHVHCYPILIMKQMLLAQQT
jgi:hypothetical protein